MFLILACSEPAAPPSPPAPLVEVPPEMPRMEADPAGTLRLGALLPTSGAHPEALLDADPASRWSPEGEPRMEGVLLRLEAPVAVDSVQIGACGSIFAGRVVVNGGQSLEPSAPPDEAGARFELEPKGQELRSLWIADAACLDTVKLVSGDAALKLAPPRVAEGRVKASSTLTPDRAYHAAYLFDGRMDFGWAEGVTGPGQGQSITIELEEALPLEGLEIWNGYQRSTDHFSKNARARTLELSVDGAPPVTLTLADELGPQRLSLPAVSAKRLELRVGEVNPGTRYEDLVISELRLLTPVGPVGVHTPDIEEGRSALKAAIAGTVLERIVDRAWGGLGACEGGGDWALRLRSDHSFVLRSHSAGGVRVDREGQPESRTWFDLIDGTWVPGKAPGSVETYARRHRVDWVFRPYGTSGGGEADSIAGGTLTFTDLSGASPEQLAAAAEGLGPAGRVENCDVPEPPSFSVQGRLLSAFLWSLGS